MKKIGSIKSLFVFAMENKTWHTSTIINNEQVVISN